jgi:hypothetical protein
VRRVTFSYFAHPTHFRRYQGRPIIFSCLPRSPKLVSAVPRATGPESNGSHFHVVRVGTSFRRYRGRRVPFSCSACPDSFPTVPMASVLVFKFCTPGLVFDGTEGVGSRFYVLRALTPFRRYRGHRVSFFLFCDPGHVFGGTEGVGSRFHVLR